MKLSFQPGSVLLDKGVVRRVFEARVRLALGQPPTLLQAEATNVWSRLRTLNIPLYITLGMSLFGLDGAGFQQACFGAYNDWVAEFCSHAPKRLFGIALISLEDIQAGAKELERCAKKGMRGAMIWGSPPRERPYSSTEYDPFWAATRPRWPRHQSTGVHPSENRCSQ